MSVNLALPGLLLVIIVIVVLVAAFVKSGKKGRVVGIASLFGIVMLMGVVTLFTARRRVAIEVERLSASRQHAATMELEQSGTVIADHALNANDAGFLADVYPCAPEAAEAVVREILREPHLQTQNDTNTTVIVFRGSRSAEAMDEPALEPIISALQQRFPKFEIVRASSMTQPSAAAGEGPVIDVRITSRYGDRSEGAGRRVSELEGFVRATIVGGGKKIERSVRYTVKPWVTSGSDMIHYAPGESALVIRPHGPVETSSIASSYARRAATAALEPMVQQRLNEMRVTGWNPDDPSCQHRLRNVIRTQLKNGNGIRDRFPQRFQRDYGTLCQETLLVSNSPRTIDELARLYLAEVNTVRSHQLHKGGAIALLALLIVGLYAFLNAATKGYYTWSLRIATVVLVAGIIFIAMTFA